MQRFTGMFAFALWDARDERLFLVRDRVGVKPLYYGRSGSTLLFGSELKALRADPDFDAVIDRNAVTLFLGTGYIPGPRTIYNGFSKLRPGTILVIDGTTGAELRNITYWSARQVAADGERDRFRGTGEEAVIELDRIIRTAVESRMVADVPVGVFLSGGVDSSLVAAIAQATRGEPVKTFSIGVRHPGYDESGDARRIARHLGTQHTELSIGAEEALAMLPRLPLMYDEPFADSSQIPTFLVSQLARRDVTVALSGDGGDELFAGYDHYKRGLRAWNAIRRLPAPLRRAAARALTTPSRAQWAWAGGGAADRMFKLAGLLNAESQQILYRRLWSRWSRPEEIVIDAAEPAVSASNEADAPPREALEQMMVLDLVEYLPDDILVKVDRASMAVSLEVREPLLDHDLIRFAWSLPPTMKMRGNESKWILRRLLQRYVPEPLMSRRKMGFSVPIGPWLRGPLRPWADDLLDPRRIENDGILVAATVLRWCREHLSGRADRSGQLWSVLMLQAWLRDGQASHCARTAHAV